MISPTVRGEGGTPVPNPLHRNPVYKTGVYVRLGLPRHQSIKLGIKGLESLKPMNMQL